MPKAKRKKRTPAWALPFEEVSANSKAMPPIHERKWRKTQRKLKPGEVAAHIREHPEWVAGRLVSAPTFKVYYYRYRGFNSPLVFRCGLSKPVNAVEVFSNFKEYNEAREKEYYAKG